MIFSFFLVSTFLLAPEFVFFGGMFHVSGTGLVARTRCRCWGINNELKCTKLSLEYCQIDTKLLPFLRIADRRSQLAGSSQREMRWRWSGVVELLFHTCQFSPRFSLAIRNRDICMLNNLVLSRMNSIAVKTCLVFEYMQCGVVPCGL